MLIVRCCLLLQELYISHNEVRDVSVAAMLPELRVLDVDRYYTTTQPSIIIVSCDCSNQLGEEDQLGYLGLCTQLSSLTLAGNPLSLLLFSQQVHHLSLSLLPNVGRLTGWGGGVQICCCEGSSSVETVGRCTSGCGDSTQAPVFSELVEV